MVVTGGGGAERERERERRREKSLCVHHARQYHVFVAVCVYCLSDVFLDQRCSFYRCNTA